MIVAYKAQIENSEEASHTEEVWVDTGEVDEEGNPVYEIEEVTVTDELGGWVEEQITDFSVENLAAYEQDGFTAVAVDDEGVETDVQWTEVEEPADPYEQVELDIAGIAAAGNQHFWHNSDGASEYGGTGAHVTDIEKDEWVDAVADGFSDLSDEKPYHNLLMNSLGILLRRALNTLVSISKTAIAFFDGEGNQASNIVASFGKDGIQIGKSGNARVELDYRSFSIYDKNGSSFFNIEDRRDSSGYAIVTDHFKGDGTSSRFEYSLTPSNYGEVTVSVDGTELAEGADFTAYATAVRLTQPPADGAVVLISYKSSSGYAKAFTFGSRSASSTIGGSSFSEGIDTSAAGYASHAEGEKCAASGKHSHAEGYGSTAAGSRSHAEGSQTMASGAFGSHAEGNGTKANGDSSHAEGSFSKAIGARAHAEGDQTQASGGASHAEGAYTKAVGSCSHAGGNSTIAADDNQTAIGVMNKETTGPLVVGIGGNGTRKNGLALDWSGSLDIAGVYKSNDKAGITQTVTIGDKTLTITGGIITGVS